MAAIREQCQRGLLVYSGSLIADGPEEVIPLFEALQGGSLKLVHSRE
jgi:hypothetical protein